MSRQEPGHELCAGARRRLRHLPSPMVSTARPDAGAGAAGQREERRNVHSQLVYVVRYEVKGAGRWTVDNSKSAVRQFCVSLNHCSPKHHFAVASASSAADAAKQLPHTLSLRRPLTLVHPVLVRQRVELGVQVVQQPHNLQGVDWRGTSMAERQITAALELLRGPPDGVCQPSRCKKQRTRGRHREQGSCALLPRSCAATCTLRTPHGPTCSGVSCDATSVYDTMSGAGGGVGAARHAMMVGHGTGGSSSRN